MTHLKTCKYCDNDSFGIESDSVLQEDESWFLRCKSCEAVYNFHELTERHRAREKESEKSKFRLFREIFRALAHDGKMDVSEVDLLKELEKTGKFTDEEKKTYVMKAMSNGQIYERRSGVYAIP